MLLSCVRYTQYTWYTVTEGASCVHLDNNLVVSFLPQIFSTTLNRFSRDMTHGVITWFPNF